MAQLKANLRVRCPRDAAREHLCGMLLEGPVGEAPQALRLAVKIPWTGVELSKDVNVEYSVGVDPKDVDEPIGVRWQPTPGGIYPSFEGELRVLPGRHSYSSMLELAGHYTPPLGVLGIGFDAAVGHRIAEATAKYLLEGLASGILARDKMETIVTEFKTLRAISELEDHVRVVRATCVVEHLALPSPPSENEVIER